jgi:hypothetical protein
MVVDDFAIDFGKAMPDGFDDSPLRCDFGGGEIVI